MYKESMKPRVCSLRKINKLEKSLSKLIERQKENIQINKSERKRGT